MCSPCSLAGSMNIHELCDELVQKYECFLLSDICSAPSDVDIYVPAQSVSAVNVFVENIGFVLTGVDCGQFVYRRFEGGELYILDLLSRFDIHTKTLTSFSLSEEGHQKIGGSTTLYKSFKYLCSKKKEKYDFVEKNKKELMEFFSDLKCFEWIDEKVVGAMGGSSEAMAAELHSIHSGHKQLYAVLEAIFCERIHRYKRRIGKGVSLAFVGPDGSGKSFFIDKLKFAGPSRVIYMGDWFFVFQGLYNKIMRVRSPYNRIVYVFYLFENFFRLLKVLFHRLLGRIILIDRFPGTNRNVVHNGFLGALNKVTFSLFLKPDFMVFLYSPPQEVYKRKQELSVEKIDEMQCKLKDLLKDIDYVFVDTRDIDKSLNFILSKIYRKE